jgi:hypothetical protein
MFAREPRALDRRGITLTEILIAIMILGVGLTSLATLFPLGLLRLRDATRYTRTKYLTDSAEADGAAQSPYRLKPDGTGGGLLNPDSFAQVDAINFFYGLTPWYVTLAPTGGQQYSPLIQDTPGYGQDWTQGTPPVQVGVSAGYPPVVGVPPNTGYGLPFAYDPLWRYQTVSQTTGINGYYLGDTFEARFGSGIGFIRNDPSDGGLPSAHGLQRITNFNRPFVVNAGGFIPIMPGSNRVPNIFVSQEDVVWVESLASNALSPVLPDLSLPSSPQAPAIDWRYSWMFTGYQVAGSGGPTFEGNIVIFENRPFGIDAVPNPPGPGLAGGTYRVAGETVVEAIFGHSRNVQGGYGAGADRTVLLRWYASEPDPVVKPGDWIADVTYERHALTVYNPNTQSGRFMNGAPPLGVPNPFNNGEWDNLPAQRCIWYQVQKVTPAIDDPYTNVNLRSMVVTVDRSLTSRTLLSAAGTPVVFNAALISPYVVNVIPRQFSVK